MTSLLQWLVSPPKQTLRTLQPTLSTIKYTVSTRSVPKTPLARVGIYIGILLKVWTGLCAAVLCWAKWQAMSGKPTAALGWALSHSVEIELLKSAEACPWYYLAPAILAVVFLLLRRGYTEEESLTVLRGIGVQTTTSSSIYLQNSATRFIPTTSIQDIFIHEAFMGFEVRFYLAVVVEDEERVVVVFPSLLPRRAMLEQVWRGARKCLWESDGTCKPPIEEKGVVETMET